MEGTFETDEVDGDGETDPFEGTPLTPSRIGLLAGIFQGGAIAAIGFLVAENIAIAGISGLMVASASFLYLPLFLTPRDEGDGLEELAPADGDAPLREFHRLAAGWALGAGGIVLLMTGFVEMDPLVGLPAALAVVVAIYLVMGFVMPNAQLPD